jgi:hypothetical protein
VKEIMTVAFDDTEPEQNPVDELFWGLIKKVMGNKVISNSANR